MLTQVLKIIIGLFFVFVSIDSLYKISQLKVDVEKDILNPKTAKIIRSRYIRTSILTMIMAVICFSLIWIQVGPVD